MPTKIQELIDKASDYDKGVIKLKISLFCININNNNIKSLPIHSLVRPNSLIALV